MLVLSSGASASINAVLLSEMAADPRPPPVWGALGFLVMGATTALGQIVSRGSTAAGLDVAHARLRIDEVGETREYLRLCCAEFGLIEELARVVVVASGHLDCDRHAESGIAVLCESDELGHRVPVEKLSDVDHVSIHASGKQRLDLASDEIGFGAAETDGPLDGIVTEVVVGDVDEDLVGGGPRTTEPRVRQQPL